MPGIATEFRLIWRVSTVRAAISALGVQYSPVSPMRALFWSAVINGLAAVPLMVVLILLVSRPKIMGRFTASMPIILLRRMTTALMAGVGIAMFMPASS